MAKAGEFFLSLSSSGVPLCRKLAEDQRFTALHATQRDSPSGVQTPVHLQGATWGNSSRSRNESRVAKKRNAALEAKRSADLACNDSSECGRFLRIPVNFQQFSSFHFSAVSFLSHSRCDLSGGIPDTPARGDIYRVFVYLCVRRSTDMLFIELVGDS